jgi:hypothetical protein
MNEHYKATFASDEATFEAVLVDFNIQDGEYMNLTDKNIGSVDKRKPPFWVTFEFADPKDPCLEHLVKASKNPDTFRPQKVTIPVAVKDVAGNIIMTEGIVPKPIKQPSAIIELRFEGVKLESA